MKLSPLAKGVFVLAVLLGLCLYAVVVDFGVNAGRIHHGVSVDAVDVGGLTLLEAAHALDERAARLARLPVVFEVQGFTKALTPEEVGWNPSSFRNAQLAMAVGRTGGPLVALRDRIDAWVRGIEIPWRGGPDARKVTALLHEWDREARRAGLEIRRGLLRYRIRKALNTWPRRKFTIPVRRE